MNIFLSPLALEKLASRDGFGSPVPRQSAHLHNQAESGDLLTGFLPISAAAPIYLFKPPYRHNTGTMAYARLGEVTVSVRFF